MILCGYDHKKQSQKVINDGDQSIDCYYRSAIAKKKKVNIDIYFERNSP
jgi:hypothetical protein